jgi:hypothetical protein
LYFGGSFGLVNGVTRNRVAAISTVTGALLPWNPSVTGTVKAIVVDGSHVYLGGAFSRVDGVTRTNLAEVDATTGAVGPWTTVHRGAVGDGRASSANGLTSEFLGDYNYAVATRDFGAAAWNDVRNAAVCPAINAYRQDVVDGTAGAAPAPLTDCPATFGNTDIYSSAAADPTP